MQTESIQIPAPAKEGQPQGVVMSQSLVFITLGLALVMFVWGKFRHDLVSLGALLLLVITGEIGRASCRERV